MGGLVSVTTEDGIKLHGVWFDDVADNETRTGRSVDVVLTVHGVGSNFYSGRMFPFLARRLNDHGIPVLIANNRGRDGVYGTLSGDRPIRLGSAFETVADCCHDLRAWCQFLMANGYRRIGLVGHSLGAIKAIYAQADQPIQGVARLVAISSPRLVFETLRSGPQGGLFQQDFEFASTAVDAGDPHRLFESRVPVPLLISAHTFVDKYGPANRYDIIKHLPKINIEAMVVFGELELTTFNGAFRGIPQAIRAIDRDPPINVETVAQADHFYTDRLASLAEVIENWLQTNDAQAENDD